MYKEDLVGLCFVCLSGVQNTTEHSESPYLCKGHLKLLDPDLDVVIS